LTVGGRTVGGEVVALVVAPRCAAGITGKVDPVRGGVRFPVGEERITAGTTGAPRRRRSLGGVRGT
jgi:hypothetical protein